jgi:hypothetical protein
VGEPLALGEEDSSRLLRFFGVSSSKSGEFSRAGPFECGVNLKKKKNAPQRK